jgi:heme/copper-type cytochrome/quinol oxidase subunit 2
MNIYLGIFGIFLIIVVGVGSWYTSRNTQQIPNTEQSVDKMTKIDEAFTSILGTKWPYVLIILSVMLGCILYLLYLSTSQELFSVTLDEVYGRRITILLGILTGIIAIGLLVLCWKAYQQRNSVKVLDYLPDPVQNELQSNLLSIIGLGLVLLGLVIGSIWYFFFRGKSAENAPSISATTLA